MRTHLLAGLALALVTGGANAPQPHALPSTCTDAPVFVAALDLDAELTRLALPCGRIALPFALPEAFATGLAESPGHSLALRVDGYPPLTGGPAAAPLPEAVAVRTLPAWSAETLQPWQLTAPLLLLDVGIVDPVERPGVTEPARECGASCDKPTKPVAPVTTQRVAVPEPGVLALLVTGLALVTVVAARKSQA